MSLLEALQPRTIEVKGARVVRLGSNEGSWEDASKYKRLTPDQRKAYHREKMRRHRQKKRGK